MARWNFPPYVNKLVIAAAVAATAGSLSAVAVFAYGTAPETTNVGYSPEQPVPFSHKLHVGTLKMDCRYCHTTVDQAAFAAVPSTSTCTNCHSGADSGGGVATSAIHTDSLKLLGVRESQASGEPIEWQRVHDLADYVYFDHSAHVNRGVGCGTCHGRVDKMEQVYQAEPLSMSWCLDCHRNPAPHLRPLDKITDMEWTSIAERAQLGKELKQDLNIHASTNCSTCHR